MIKLCFKINQLFLLAFYLMLGLFIYFFNDQWPVASVINNILIFIIIVIAIFLILLLLRIYFRKGHFVETDMKHLLIIAPHQDDGVAMAAGLAMNVLAQSGKVTVLYMTNGSVDDKEIRKNEAIEAWKCIGLSSEALVFLNHETRKSFIQIEEVKETIFELVEFIRIQKPDKIVVPLYEGGHYQHDITNYMISIVLKRLSLNLDMVLESPLYNFYLSLINTPERILSAIFRLIPFITFEYSQEPVDSRRLYYAPMNRSQIDSKRKMLSKFLSQNPKQLINRFGYQDRFQKYQYHNYAQPPFNYNLSIIKLINKLKKYRLFKKILQRCVCWSHTIHLDSDYEITTIPFILD